MADIDEQLARDIRYLRDRADIEDCIQRYCRGADRLDKILLCSAYHPDATDDRGEAFTGSPAQFADWLFPFLRTLDGTSHTVCNSVSDIDGDTAHTESYVVFAVWKHAREGEEGFASMGTARYLDRLERRDGRWGIAHRECIVDMTVRAPIGTPMAGALFGARDRTDRAYARPLEPTPAARERLAKLG
jgi:hypothetical protein